MNLTVTPAKAGVHVLSGMDAGLRGHDAWEKKHG